MVVPTSALARDGPLAVALTALAQVELVLAADQVQGSLALQHAAFAVLTASVALRRRLPLGAAVVCAAGMTAQTLAGPAPVVGGFVALLVVVASLGYFATLPQGLVGLAVLLASASVYDLLAERFVAADFLGNALIVTGAWGAAQLLRASTDRRVAAEVARERFAHEAVLRERDRIARDLHDSVAHALTLMTLQAGGARERAEGVVVVDALRSIEEEGRQALADMHRSLRLLGNDSDMTAEALGLQDLVDMVDRVRAGGMAVELSMVGDVSSVPASVSFTGYRVVQEALTNAMKHAGARRATVEVARSQDELRICVWDDGGGRDRARIAVGSGRGLSSLRERLSLFDGRLVAAPADDVGWLLQATIPLRRMQLGQ